MAERSRRGAGCSVSLTGDVAGWRSVVLENGKLRVVVLPDKGAEIHQIVDLRTGTEILFEASWGLQQPGAVPLPGSGEDAFMWNYAGGWQELFPSVNAACTYRGRPIPFHGEVASLPWQHEVLEAGDDEVAVRFWTRCRVLPFLLERVLRLRAGDATLTVEGTVVNESPEVAHFVWGHHCVVGPPFLEAGCRLEIPARTIVTSPELWEADTARLEPARREPWPLAPLRGGGTVDLRDIPGPDTGSHDDLYVTELDAGWLAVSNPRLDLTFRLEWDHTLFGWIVLWQPYGGAVAPPLAGSYALGIEPWTSMLNLEEAVAAGTATELAGGASLTTTLQARLLHGR
jgi:galactose mutarotase-like enzyme